MTAEIYPAYVAALAELSNPVKDAKADTGRFSYSYATLPAILELARPILAKHGLGVVQNVTVEEGKLRVWTTILHASGEELTFGPITGSTGGDWQQLGSATTYARRYGLTAALGIAGEDDDDAQAVKPAQKPAQAQAMPTYTRESKIERVTLEAPAEDDPWATRPAEAVVEELLGGEVITADGMDNGRALPPSESTVDRSQMHKYPATEKQLNWARKLITAKADELGVEPFEYLNALLVDIHFPEVGSWEELGKSAASQIIEKLK